MYCIARHRNQLRVKLAGGKEGGFGHTREVGKDRRALESPWERRVLTAKNTGFKRSHGQEHRIQTFSRLKTQLTSHGTMKRGARLERAVRGKNKEAEGTKKEG